MTLYERWAAMVPIVLNTEGLRIAVAGNGPQAVGRLEMLRRHHTAPSTVFAPQPSAELREAAGARLTLRWPGADDLAEVDVLFAGDLEPEQAEVLRKAARRSKTLLNIEDVRSHCDFHMPATVRRGDLLLTVSTGGASPGLAGRIRAKLNILFGNEWAERLNELCRRRAEWRAAGLDVAALRRETDLYIDQKGWLS